MKPTAYDVAAFVIKYSIAVGHPISNLQLQKILFMSQCESLGRTYETMFDDEIVAWQFGPVIRGVYNTYSYRGASSLKKAIRPYVRYARNKRRDFICLSECGVDITRRIVDKYAGGNPWELVHDACRPYGAWYTTYYDIFGKNEEGAGFGNEISDALMFNEESFID